MATSQNSEFLSVFEALNILTACDSNMNIAIRDIFVKCNIPDNDATLVRFRRKFDKVKKNRLNAHKSGKLDNWLTEAK